MASERTGAEDEDRETRDNLQDTTEHLSSSQGDGKHSVVISFQHLIFFPKAHFCEGVIVHQAPPVSNLNP